MIDASDNPAYMLLQAAIGEALDCLASKRLVDKRVHAARKAVKKARAGLRLLRPAMSDVDYRLENTALRDAGRSLSPLRDARSVLDAFNGIASRHSAELRDVDLAPLNRSLIARRRHARRELIVAPTRLRQCVDRLKNSRERMRQSELAHAERDATIDGFRHIYRKGRKTFARARDSRSLEALHEWRKQVKYLLVAATVLRRSGMSHLQKLAERAGRVADWLGEDHDLAMLHEAVRDSSVGTGAAAVLYGLIALRRAKLQDRALDLGRRLFASKPKRFAAHLHFEMETK